MPKFSICVPVRNGAQYLQHTLRLCVEQLYFDDYEIVVSDNQSSEDIKSVVDAFDSPRIRYVRTPSYIGMGANFDFSLDNALGEYKLIIGSDDGISRYALYALDKVIQATGERLIQWNRSEYFWPGHHYMQNQIGMYTNLGQSLMNGEDMVRSYVKVFGGDPPHIYDSAVMHRDLITETERRIGGKLHDSFLADFYQAIMSALVAKRYIKLRLPLSLYAERTGTAGSTTENSLTDEYLFRRHSTDEIAKMDARTISSSSIFKRQFHFYIQKYLILCQALDRFPDELRLTAKDIRVRKVINQMLTEYAFRSSVNGKADEFQTAIDLLWEDVNASGDEKLKTWFIMRFLRERNDDRYISRMRNYFDAENKNKFRFIMNCGNFGAEDVYGAMVLWDKANLSKSIVDKAAENFSAAYHRAKELCAIIRERVKAGGRLGVYGAGVNGVRMARVLRYFIPDMDFDLVFFDQSATAQEFVLAPSWYSYPVRSPERISDENLDAIVTSLYRYDEEVYRIIRDHDEKLEIIKLFEPYEVNWLAELCD